MTTHTSADERKRRRAGFFHRFGKRIDRMTLTAGRPDAKQVLSNVVNGFGEHRERFSATRLRRKQ